MRCEYPNTDNVYDRICGATAVWMVQIGAQGYPRNVPITQPAKPYCPHHAIAVQVSVIAEPERHWMSVHAIRIENAANMQQIAGKRIGQ